MASSADKHSAPSAPRVALVQDGARGHYGLALALHQAGLLDVMFTDFFIKQGGMWDLLSPLLSRAGPGGLRRMMDRREPGLNLYAVGHLPDRHEAFLDACSAELVGRLERRGEPMAA